MLKPILVTQGNYTKLYSVDVVDPETAEFLSRQWLIGEPPSKLPSLTIPDQVPSMMELIDRFVRGDGTEVYAGGQAPEDFPPGVENMDFSDKAEFARHYADKAEDIRERLQQRAVRIEETRERMRKRTPASDALVLPDPKGSGESAPPDEPG